MKTPTTHSYLITVGCLLWCASFFGEAFKGQPYSTVGIIISPILTVVGLYFWFNISPSKRGFFSLFNKVWDNIVFDGGRFTLKSDFLLKHVLKFWTSCILFWMVIVLITLLTFRCSEIFEKIKIYCDTNQEIIAKTGEIKYYGILLSGNVTSLGQKGKPTFVLLSLARKGIFMLILS